MIFSGLVNNIDKREKKQRHEPSYSKQLLDEDHDDE